MRPDPIRFRFEKSELLVVPAVHFHHVFADEVNRICAHPETRPEAIAIELGPQSAAAAKRWLVELGAAPGEGKKLPIMLGLMKRNHMIRSSLREKALSLQKETGKDLSELPLEILRRELGYSNRELLCLSPTDSIIEAIRCAIELDLPLYGVDLEDMANTEYGAIMIQEPIEAEGNMKEYVAQNAYYATLNSDKEIDTRREMAMAARIKTLLKRYQRVLFTCGLGHWLNIMNLLEDEALRAALISEIDDEKQKHFRRFIVHPLIAVQSLSLFPALAEEYEQCRKPSYKTDTQANTRRGVDVYGAYERLMENAYQKYFKRKRPDQWTLKRHQDLRTLDDFDGHLENIRLAKLRSIPNFSMIAEAAQDIMSEGLVNALTQTFMDIDWVKPEDHPDCPILAPSTSREDASACVIYDKKGLPDGKPFYAQTVHSNGKDTVEIRVPYEWPKKRKEKHRFKKEDSVLHSWAPWDNLISALSLKAIGYGRKKTYQRRAEVFEGSLLDGIDIKSTLRAYSRGEKQVYVWENIAKHSTDIPRTGEGFPVVWILEPGEHPDSDWAALYEYLCWMKKHIRDQKRFNHIRETKGDRMIAFIGYGDLYAKTPATKAQPEIRCDRYDGMLLFHPICWGKSQFTHWFESTGGKRNPFCYSNYLGDSFSSDLITFLDKKHGIRIGEFDWATTLMLLGIPFAKKEITVVIPNDFAIPSVVFEKAKAYGVEVRIAPLNIFGQKKLERISLNYMVPVKDYRSKCRYPKSYEKAIGEKQNAYQDLVPQEWYDFGKNIR